MTFLVINNLFLVRFQNTEQNKISVFIVFKAESEPKHKENIFWFFFKTKNALFQG